MKKFLFLHYGFEEPTSEIMDQWNSWFESVGDRILDMGGFTNGREISHEGIKDLPWGKDSITGFNIIQAEDLDEAIEMAKSNPYISSIRIYELRTS